jgi:hypothetical protein
MTDFVYVYNDDLEGGGKVPNDPNVLRLYESKGFKPAPELDPDYLAAKETAEAEERKAPEPGPLPDWPEQTEPDKSPPKKPATKKAAETSSEGDEN